MNSKELTSKEYFKSLTVIHAALLFGQILFGGVAFGLNTSGQLQLGEELKDLTSIFNILIPFLVIGGVFGSTLLSKNRLKTIREKKDLKEKLGDYRTLQVLKLALLEVPSFFALVCYLVTGNFMFLAFSAIIIVVFFINRPSKARAIYELELNSEEKALIDEDDAVIAKVKNRNQSY